jgi:predicted dehydrogenase
MSSLHSISRRRFVRLSASLAAGIFAAPAFVRGQNLNSKLRGVFIGVDGKGGDNIGALGKAGIDIAALCDADSAKTKAAAAKLKHEVEVFQDYRKLFDTMPNDAYDVVIVSTPDHHHFPATLRALKAKKHVYCEKPLTHTIWEARQINRLAAEAGVVTQMGNQGNAGLEIRETAEWIKTGVIGKIKEIHSWSNRPIWPQGQERPTGEDPVPETLDWDVWIGPAPMRPYKNGAYHPFKWRGYWDFGTGALGDMGCHIINWPFTAMEMGYPTSVELVKQEGMTADMGPKRETIRYEFAAKGDQPAYTLFWHDGGWRPSIDDLEIELKPGQKFPENGTLFIGEKGKLFAEYVGKPYLTPKSKWTEVKAPEPSIPRSIGHHQEFTDAIRTGKKAGSDFVIKACRLTEVVLLGNLAARVGKRIEWDSETGTAKNAPEAGQYIQRSYRPGWI